MIFEFETEVRRRDLNTANGPMTVYEQRGYCYAPGARHPMPFDVRVDNPSGYKPYPALYVASASSLATGQYGDLIFARNLSLREVDDATRKWWESCPVKA